MTTSPSDDPPSPSPWARGPRIGTGWKLAIGAAFILVGVVQFVMPQGPAMLAAGPIPGWPIAGVMRQSGSQDLVEVTLQRAPGHAEDIDRLDLRAICQTLITTPEREGGLPDIAAAGLPLQITAIVQSRRLMVTRSQTRSATFRIIGGACIAPGTGQGA